MSGFVRNAKRYGDRLVYEMLLSKWDSYHARHCGCPGDWVETHVEARGFVIVGEGSGYVAIVGAGLTEDVDEGGLTTDVLWEAVTGKPGKGWVERVRGS